MELTWTRNGGEIWNLSAVFLISLGLSLLSAIMPEPMSAQYSSLLFLLLTLPHLPAFVYGVYVRETQTPTTPGYPLALFTSLSISLYLITGVPPSPPVIVTLVLLISTYHMYVEYDDHGDFVQVVLLFMVYAPWAQFLGMFTGYMRFV